MSELLPPEMPPLHHHHHLPPGPPPGLALSESKHPLNTLKRLQEFIREEYTQLSAILQADVSNCQYLRVMKMTPHPVLVTQPSLNIVCRVNAEMQISCLVQSFNLITIKEIQAAFEEDKVSDTK